MIRQVIQAAVLLLFAHGAIASDCVVGVTMDGVRPDEHRAVASVVSISTYANVVACNDAMANSAKLLPHTQAAQNLVANRVDSLTFTCEVPSDCYPNDKDDAEPYSRVVYLHD